MPRLNKVLAGFLIVGLTALPATSQIAQAGDNSEEASEARELTAFAGTYRYSGGEAEKEKAYAAVEETASHLNFMLRGIARKMLKKSATPKPTEELKVEGNKITLGMSSKRYTLEVGGPSIEFRGDDRKNYRMSIKQKGDKLVLRVVGHKSTTIKTYRLSKDGSKIKIKTKINHPMMHKPLVYKFSYRR